jgi:hypothetical protein
MALGILGVVALLGFPAFAGSSMAFMAGAGQAPANPLALQVKLLAIAASVYAILQAVKQAFPISGLGAVALNVGLSVLAVLVVVKPEDFFSLPTFTTVAIAAIMAAGAHGTVKSLSSGDNKGDSQSGSGAGVAKSGLVGILCLSIWACSFQSTLAVVEKSLPTAVKIATSVLAIVNGAPLSPTELSQINAGVAFVSDKLNLTHTLIDQYQADLKNAPPGVIGQIDAAVEAAQSAADQLSTLCINCSAKQQAAIQFAITSVSAVIEEVVSLLPAQVAASAPRTAARLATRGLQPGQLKVPIVSAKDLAKRYNANIAADFPHAQVPVP